MIETPSVVAVRPRYHRSVNVTADFEVVSRLDGYIATPTIRQLAKTIAASAFASNGTRAWTLTGPYGGGKSAFCLFLADLLGRARSVHPTANEVRHALSLGRRAMVPVLVTAERAPLAPLIVRSCRAATSGGRAPRMPAAGRPVDSADVIASLESILRAAGKQRKAGVLLVIDELGKFLEYAALHPDQADVYLLQQIAEYAARSRVPLVVVTTLHSGFADYVPASQQVRRAEWQKVQGRFNDIPFQLPADQVLELVAEALEVRASAGLQKQWRSTAARWQHALSGTVAGSKGAADLARRCLPLHPAVSRLLWPVFRSKGAQNERSLFAFLTSYEPFGFQEFLAADACAVSEGAVYGLPRLYDYLATSFGGALTRGDQSRGWALAQVALDRLAHDAPPLAAEVVKVVALLDLYGTPVGLLATRGVVEASLPASGAREAIEWLENRSIVLFRKHRGAYVLWGGSDLDLEAEYKSAAARVRDGIKLYERLARLVRPPQIVARAHFLRRGTLRRFEVIWAPQASDITGYLPRESDADGFIVFTIADDDELRLDASPLNAREITRGRPLLVATPKEADNVGSLVREMEIWRHVLDTCPALATDTVAAVEVRSRLDAATKALFSSLGPLVGLPGYRFDPSLSRWHDQGGTTCDVSDARAFQRLLSEILDRAYSSAPILHNEILNRAHLSSAAAAARRLLVQRMLEESGEDALGIEGMPAERSMFNSMLLAGGLYRAGPHGWQFVRPTPTSPWHAAWQEMDRYLAEGQGARRSVVGLFDRLNEPPVGLREGPRPVLLVAYLLARGEEVALYEDGVLVPTLKIEIFERLMRRPEHFELREHHVARAQRQALREILRVLPGAAVETGNREDVHVVAVARALIEYVAALPQYTRRTRRHLSAQAQAVRDAILSASDPMDLLFGDLPRHLGHDGLSNRSASRVVASLREVLSELSRAYLLLLDEIEQQLRSALRLSGPDSAALAQLKQRADSLSGIVADPRLLSFVREAQHPSSNRDWRERLARALSKGMPPTHWRDADLAQFQLRLREAASDMLRLEELAAEARESGAPRVVRIGVLDRGRAEQRRVFALSGMPDEDVAAVVDRLRAALSASPDSSADERAVQLEALARAAAELLDFQESQQVENHD